MEDTYKVTYEKGNSFTIHLPDRDLVFHRREKLYIADFSNFLDDRHLYLTKTYMKGEEACTRVVYDPVRHSGYHKAIHLVQDGNMTHVLGITAEDMKRAIDIFGEPVGSVRGKMTRKLVTRAIYDDDLVANNKQKLLHTDVMHIDCKRFLVTVSVPLHLTM
jgi:hypothetical protein